MKQLLQVTIETSECGKYCDEKYSYFDLVNDDEKFGNEDWNECSALDEIIINKKRNTKCIKNSKPVKEEYK